MNKTREELRNEILLNLAISIGINITDEGSIALAIVDALIDEIYGLYEELEYIRRQSYITTSSNDYTELIANLVNIQRGDFESDDNLKLRAQNSVYKHAKGNIIAIEETARDVIGVADIEYRPFGKGAGSFVLFVYPEANTNQYRIIERVREALTEVVSEGVYYEVRAPEEVAVDIEMIVSFKESATVSERNIARQHIEREIRQYLNGLEMNEILYINELISTAMEADDNILDVNIIEYMVGGAKRPMTNTYPANEERFMSGDIQIH